MNFRERNRYNQIVFSDFHTFTSSSDSVRLQISPIFLRSIPRRRFHRDVFCSPPVLAPLPRVGRLLSPLVRGEHRQSRGSPLHSRQDPRLGKLRQSKGCVEPLRSDDGEPRPPIRNLRHPYILYYLMQR